MKQIKIRKLTFSALYMALAMVLPFLTGQIPQIGAMLCPMHIPALLCGFVCGWQYGLVVGFLSPLLRSIVFGMPALYPSAVSMAFELGTYGAAAGFIHRKLPKFRLSLYVVLLISMVLGRIVWGGGQLVLTGITHSEFSMNMFIAGAVTSALPGIILQLVLIPPLVALMDRTGLMLNK